MTPETTRANLDAAIYELNGLVGTWGTKPRLPLQHPNREESPHASRGTATLRMDLVRADVEQVGLRQRQTLPRDMA